MEMRKEDQNTEYKKTWREEYLKWIEARRLREKVQ
jgi:hypothetical protein